MVARQGTPTEAAAGAGATEVRCRAALEEERSDEERDASRARGVIPWCLVETGRQTVVGSPATVRLGA